MPDQAASIKAKLLNISKQNKVEFQDLLNQFGAEQFLARLGCSPYVDKFIDSRKPRRTSAKTTR